MKILLVEDHPGSRRNLQRLIGKRGHEVIAVGSAEEAEAALATDSYPFLIMDWMLPGVAPTGKRVEIPLVAIVRFKKGKLVHEHIYWDQASVLVQIGLLDPAQLPVAGVETAHKVLDPSLPANELMKRADAGQSEVI